MRYKWKQALKRSGAALIAALLLTGQQSCFVSADEPRGPGYAMEESGAQPGPDSHGAQQADAGTQPVNSGGEENPGDQAAEQKGQPQIDPASLPPMGITYCIFQNQIGWSRGVRDSLGLRAANGSFATAVRFYLEGQTGELTGTATYQAYVSGSGWLEWVGYNAEVGNSNGAMPVEAISVKLTETIGDYYDVYYSVWQNGAWTGWSMNGAAAGIEGGGMPVEGISAAVLPKGSPAPQIREDAVDPSRPMVALTFDDGPSAAVTSRILNSLEANGGRATFFMVGNRVPGTRAVVKRMVDLGCQVGNHTYEHKYLTKIGDGGIRSQVGLTNQKIAEACGVAPTIMRPPGGYYDKASLNTLGSMGMSAIMWNIDTLDWKTRNAQNTIHVVLSQVKDGDIVLMHDIYSASADAAEVIIPELVRRGYQLVTVSELARHRGGLKAGAVYNRFRP